MYVNNNLYFVVGNLVTEIYFFKKLSSICVWEKRVFSLPTHLTSLFRVLFLLFGSQTYTLKKMEIFILQNVLEHRTQIHLRRIVC